MAIRWKRKFRPQLVLSRIATARTKTPDGAAAFHGMLDEQIAILGSMLEFPEAARHSDKSMLIWPGLTKAPEPLEEYGFLTAINAQLNARLATRLRAYVLVTTLSLHPDSLPRSLRLPNARLECLRGGLPKAWQVRRAEILRYPTDIPNTPEDYTWIRIHVEAKSAEAGGELALEQLNVMRGLWARYANFEMQSTLFGSAPYRAMNRVRTGGVHTIHETNGEPASEGVWYEPKFQPTAVYRFEKPQLALHVIRRLLSRISAAPYSSHLLTALAQYAIAFDDPEHDSASIKLWSALELLTTSSNPVNYDDLVRRCAFLYADAQWHVQVLEHLREHRNALVHRRNDEGKSPAAKVEADALALDGP